MLYSNRRLGGTNRYGCQGYKPQYLQVGHECSVCLSERTKTLGRTYRTAHATGLAPLERIGVFLLAAAQSCRTASALNPITGKRMGGATVECPSCVLRLDLRPSESGKMKSEPQARRSSQRGLDPGTGGCVSQRIRVPLDTECSVSHAVTDAVRGLTSIYMIGLGLLCPEPCHPDIKE